MKLEVMADVIADVIKKALAPVKEHNAELSGASSNWKVGR